MTTNMQQWKNAGVGLGGLLATVTLERWNAVAAASAASLTAIYMGWKIWKDIVKPLINKLKKKHKHHGN